MFSKQINIVSNYYDLNMNLTKMAKYKLEIMQRMTKKVYLPNDKNIE